MEDTSLDRFLDAGSESEDSASGADAGEESTSGTGDAESPDLPTSRCVREERECEACGTAVGRLWRDSDQMVCPECKDWG